MNNIIMCTVKSNTTFIRRWENRTLIKIERRVFTRLLFFSQIFARDIKRKQYYKRATRQIFFSFILCGFGFQCSFIKDKGTYEDSSMKPIKTVLGKYKCYTECQTVILGERLVFNIAVEYTFAQIQTYKSTCCVNCLCWGFCW